MSIKHLVVAAALITTACSSEKGSESTLTEAEAIKKKPVRVEKAKPESLDLTQYDIVNHTGYDMKIKLDISTEKSCYRSAAWRLTKINDGEYYVRMEMLPHPMVMCTPNLEKEHALGLEIDIPADANSSYTRLYVQRMGKDLYKRSLEAVSQKDDPNGVQVIEEAIEAQAHFISIQSPAGFTAMVDYAKETGCWASNFYTTHKIDERTVFVERRPAMHPAIPCMPNQVRTFYTGVKFDVTGQGAVNYMNVIVSKQAHEAKFPKVTARKK
jgi:hypothetical protein